MALTPKQQRFVDAYLIEPIAAKAARVAGSTAKRAEQAGHELLRNPDVRAAIDAANAERSKSSGITAERVLSEIANMAFYDPSDLMVSIDPEDYDGEARPEVIVEGRIIYGLRGPADIKRLPENVRRAIVGWGYDRNQNFTVKLADKSKALDQLARHLSLYNDKLEVTGMAALADRMERAMKRGD